MQRIPLLLALAFIATTAHAQGVFRSVMPDGKIVYGSKPEPGAKESKQVNLAPLNISAPTQGAPAPPEQPQSQGANVPDLASARQNLEAAQKALEAGREPQEGERTGIATKGGGARTQLTEAYFQRVKSLEDSVAAAQAQLDAAQRAAR